MQPHHEPSFNKRIYEARQSKGWSQREAAKVIGIPHSRLAEFESGHDSHTGKPTVPSYERIIRIAKAYGLPAEELLLLAGFEPLAELTDEERELIRLFREISPTKRERTLNALKRLKGDESEP